jgi:hypothetical protein
MPKIYMSSHSVDQQALRRVAAESELRRMVADNLTCRLIDQHGLNSAALCVALKIEPSRLPAWLLGNQKCFERRGTKLPFKYTIGAMEKLPQDLYAAKVKQVRLGLGQYSSAKRALCNATGDRLPDYGDKSLRAEKLRTPFSEADFQQAAVDQLTNRIA